MTPVIALEVREKPSVTVFFVLLPLKTEEAV